MDQTALIVDDHRGFRLQARRILEAAGYAVVGEADNAQEALDAARWLQPDLVVLDVQLPDRSGLEIAGQLLEHSGSVLLVSSRDRAAYGDRITDSGAQGFIWKGDLTAASIAAALGERA